MSQNRSAASYWRRIEKRIRTRHLDSGRAPATSESEARAVGVEGTKDPGGTMHLTPTAPRLRFER
jgi:hypothetical protein